MFPAKHKAAASMFPCDPLVCVGVTMREENQSDTRVTLCHRRRRKKPRLSTSADDTRRVPHQEPERENDTPRHRQADDSRGFLLHKDDPRSLSILLHLRATGRVRPKSVALLRARSMGKQSIRFSQLRTSNSEAVLALEQSGSYFVSLAGNTAHFTLALCLYGVPSPFVLEKAKTEMNFVVSPLITTIPLVGLSDDESDER